jgi:single-strand DNA-binding protein
MELIGRITADAKVAILKDGRQVVNFSIAINDSYKPKGSELYVQTTNYVQCAYWISSKMAPYLTRSTLVELYGRLGVNAYNNKEGEAQASLKFHVNHIKLHGKPKSSENTTASANQAVEMVAVEATADDLPF